MSPSLPSRCRPSPQSSAAEIQGRQRPPLPRGGCLRSAQTGGEIPAAAESLPCVKGGGICEANDGGIVRCAKAHLRFLAPPFFSFSFRRKKRTAAASEEACSIPLPPGRRKLHIRSLLLPSRKPTAALGRLSVPIRKGKRRPENLSDGSLDFPSTKGLALGSRGVWNSANTQ